MQETSVTNRTHRKWCFLNDPRVLFASRYSRYQAFPVPSTPGWRITIEDLETDHGRLERKDDASNWLPLNRVIPSKATQPSKLGVTALGVLWSGFYFKPLTSNALVGAPTTTSRVWIHGRLLQIENHLSTEKCPWSSVTAGNSIQGEVPRVRFSGSTVLDARQFDTNRLMSKTSTRVAKKRLGGDKEVLRNALQRRFREGHWRLPFSCCSLVDSYVYSYHERKYTLLRVLWDATFNEG